MKKHHPIGPGPKDPRQQAADHILFLHRSLDAAVRAARKMDLVVEFTAFPGSDGYAVEVYEEDRTYF